LKSVFLEVMENNHRAIQIYRRNGFQERHREQGVIRMVRPLVLTAGAD
jgi:ribosomal protein S18 acetylase RimI-like enzyme